MSQSEQEVIAALLSHPHLARECDLQASEFRFDNYQEIYRAIRNRADENKGFDLVTLADDFQQQLPSHLASELFSVMAEIMSKSVGSQSMFNDYCQLVRKDFKLRQLEEIANQLIYEIRENKNLDAADKTITDLMALERTGNNHVYTLEEAVKAGLAEVERVAELDGLPGIDTGIEVLNESLGGFNATDLIVIGGRPAMGKTAILLNCANRSNVPCGVISAEQPYTQVGKRMFSIEGSLDAQRIRLARLDEDFVNDLGRAARRLINKKMWIYDQSGMSIGQVAKMAREFVHRYGVKILFVDYLQKIKPSDKRMSAKEAAAEIAGTLKNLAKELCIPVVCLAQVNREVDKRTDPRPHQGDLSNAGEIEQEADAIIMAYRDEVYNPDTPDKGILELLVEKNRHGPTGRLRCAWIGKYMQVRDLTHSMEDR